MTVRSTSLATARLIMLSVIIAALPVVGHPRSAQAQSMRSGGSIGVSLTILQPVATQAVSLIGFSVDRSGIARFETSTPVSGPTSQLVMTSVSSSMSNARPVEQPATMVGARHRSPADGDTTLEPSAMDGSSNSAPVRFSYVVNVGKQSHGSNGDRPVMLRIQYLAVAGT